MKIIKFKIKLLYWKYKMIWCLFLCLLLVYKCELMCVVYDYLICMFYLENNEINISILML